MSKRKTSQDLEKKREELVLLERKLELKQGLPHLYGRKWYSWAREFFDSHEKMHILCAANQISKSSTQIRTCIDWATNPAKWESLWGRNPNQFWYLYPTQKQVDAEFQTKWSEFLPRGKYKTEEVIDDKPNYYAWKEIKKNKELVGIHFFVAGVYVYFKTYAQDTEALQTGSCYAIFCDEELPVEHYDEIIFRISATDGYFRMVFTATLGQEFWRLCMEPEPSEKENLPEAKKQSVSLYDSQVYLDGTPSQWTDERIAIVKARCKSEEDVLRRVMGRFVVSKESKKYPQFDVKRHYKDPHPLPKEWLYYAGLDSGSGGKENHPGAICFVAVSPDYQKGRVVESWRGDDESTTAGDLLNKYREMRARLGVRIVQARYDFSDRDLFEIATRVGEPLTAADKSHDKGEDVINTLFKNDMMALYDTPENRKLGTELKNLRKDTPKNKAKDDLSDAFRYAVVPIPWDFNIVTAHTEPPALVEKQFSPLEKEINERRQAFEEAQAEEHQRIEDEFAEANEAYG